MKTNKRTGFTAAVCLAVLGFSIGCASTGNSPVTMSQQTSDATLSANVAASFEQDRALRYETITVSTIDGVVTLTGVVRTSNELDRATAIARMVPNVQLVKNHLTMGNTSS